MKYKRYEGQLQPILKHYIKTFVEGTRKTMPRKLAPVHNSKYVPPECDSNVCAPFVISIININVFCCCVNCFFILCIFLDVTEVVAYISELCTSSQNAI
jgi:hypothetical protein